MPDPVIPPSIDARRLARDSRRDASSPNPVRFLLATCALAIVIGSFIIGASRASEKEPTGASTESIDWTLAVSPDAALYVRWSSIGRFRSDIETFLTSVNPLASMLLGGMSAQLQSDPLYLSLDLEKPVALASIAPDVENRGGLVWIVPLDDAKLFRESFEAKEFPDVTLHEHHGYAVLTSDPKQSPETIFAKRAVRSAGGSSMSGTVQIADVVRMLEGAIEKASAAIAAEANEADSAATEDAAPEGRPERSLATLLPDPVLDRARAVAGLVGDELSELAFDIDVGRQGMFVRASANPVEGSRFATFLAAQKASAGSMRAVGDPSDMLRMYGRIDPRALLADGPANGEASADGFASQLRALAEVLSGEFAVSLDYDHTLGFAGSQWLATREGADAGAVLETFAENPAWLTMVHSSAGASFRAAAPTKIENVTMRDYRLAATAPGEAGSDAVAAMAAETIGGVLVGASKDRILVALGRTRADRMRAELSKLESTKLPPTPERVPRDAMFVLSLSLIDYTIATLSRIPGGPIPADALKNTPIEGKARMTAFASASPEELRLGINLSMDTLQRFVNWGQQQMMSAMMNQRARARGGDAAEEGNGEPDGTPPSYVGHSLPELELRDLAGNIVSLGDQKGKVVILDFFATWNPPCIEQVPAFVELHEEYADRGLVILAVSDEMKQDIETFAKEHGVPYPLLQSRRDVLPGPLVAPFAEIVSVPTTFVIDRTGKVAAVHVGYRPKSVFVDSIEAHL